MVDEHPASAAASIGSVLFRAHAVRVALTACMLTAALLPARALDLAAMWLVRTLRPAPGPSSGITLLVAEGLSEAERRKLMTAGAAEVRPGTVESPERGPLEGALRRRMPAVLAGGGEVWLNGPSYIDWRGSIDTGAFLGYDMEDLRGGKIPPEALTGRLVLFGPRGTGMSELLATPIGLLTELEYAANVWECARGGRPFRMLPLWLQLSLALVPLGLTLRAPGRAWYGLAAAAGLLLVAGCAAVHLLPGLLACTGGWLVAWLLPGPGSEALLDEALSQGRFADVLAQAAPEDDYHRARALAGLKRYDEVEALLAHLDLRRFPAEGGTALAVALEKAGCDAPALVLLEWAIVSGGPTAERSALAADLRARQSNLKGLLGMEGIQRLISGRYANLSFLGQGGMGIVLRGDDTFLGRRVALKVLNPSLLSDPGSRARFRREVETMMTLNHPAIIEIHAVHSDDLLYFAMEFLEGASLREALQKDAASVDRERALREVAGAMAYCHDQGILHRDLKADNVFILKDGRVKLIDFGIARAMGGTDLTAQGELVGTLGYLAPEMFRGGQASPQADIFAFGVMAFDVYAGRLPFAHPLSMGTIVPPPEMPFGMQAVMLRCLAAEPAERFGSFREVQAALASF